MILSFDISPMNIIHTLSMALEMAVDGVNKHQLRTAVICHYIAEKMGMPQHEQQQLITAALLHDIGAAPNLNERMLLLTPARDKEFGNKIHSHSEEGCELLKKSPCFSDIAEIVRHHHASWDGSNGGGLRGEQIPLASRIIHLADFVDVAIKRSGHILAQSEAIEHRVVRESGKKFDPQVVEAFMLAAQQESFWLDAVNPAYAQKMLETANARFKNRMSPQELLNIAELYATLIDRMSIFTATHSRSVSGVAVMLAKELGFCENEQYMMRVAGLLHDLGKLSLPNTLLEKKGPLNPCEMRLVRQHAYFSYRILEQLEGLSSILYWAALHHETLDGNGYPFRLKGDQLPLGSRIMAVADIFVALAEDRPYRRRTPKPKLKGIMQAMVDGNKIDARVVRILFDKYDEAYAIVHDGGSEYTSGECPAHGHEDRVASVVAPGAAQLM